MSILNKNKAFSVRDYLFISVGLLGLFWFFLTYASNEPRTTMDASLGKQSATVKATQILNSLGYGADNFNARSYFESNGNLIDSLQAHLGRQQMISTFSDSLHSGIYPFYWETRFLDSGDRDANLILKLDEEGRLIEFVNSKEVLPDNPLNKEALVGAFNTDGALQLWTSLPDSAWKRALSFDLENYTSSGEDQFKEQPRESSPHGFSRTEIRRLAEYHLSEGGWDPDRLKMTDIQIHTIKSSTAADLVFQSNEPYLGQTVQLEATVLPTGALLKLGAEYNSLSENDSLSGEYLRLIRIALVILFGLATVVVFYFRIRSRTIDTNPALVVAVVAGLIFPAIIFLEEIPDLSLFGGTAETSSIILILRMGVAGAFASVSYFAVFAVADSLMRQYWPDKLSVYDYVRQGMFFNKPVGETLVRSIVLAFILCGVWTTLLLFSPDLYFEVDRTFLQEESAWPPVFLFLNSAWFSLIMILAIFPVVGALVYSSFRNKWVTGLVMVAGFALMAPVLQEFGPDLQEITVFAAMGTAFAVIFLKWDFVTTLLSHFLFLVMLEVSSGWIVANSPDLYVFIIFCVFLLLLTVIGIFAIVKGQERQSLPVFVPEYVEELAQEQRIKQELQIAREVQQSFLPVKTPEFEQLELAAICKPAFETGGDYYDFVRLDEHRVAVMVGDVSGKGIQAAFYMTFVKGVIHSLCREIDSPAEVMKKTNYLFCQNAPRGTFISLIYGIIDVKKKTFQFARAGHNPIIRVTANNGQVEELRPKGIGIGLSRDGSFEQHIEEVKLPIRENDLLVLYTDGIVEALNEHGKFYGTKKLNNIVNSNRSGSAQNVLISLSEDVRSFIGNAKQHDDMTAVVMKMNNTNRN